jgi:hypothetical protein
MPGPKFLRALSVALCLLTQSIAVQAEPEKKPEAEAETKSDSAANDRWILNFVAENDLFGSSRDQHYTHGSKMSVLSPGRDVPEFAHEVADFLPMFPDGGSLRIAYSAGQSIFTPDNIRDRIPPEDSRPYAGWLYGGIGIVSEKDDRIDALDLNIGMVGPASLTERTQKTWHKWVNSPEPLGWDTQIRNEPGILLTYERKWRSLIRFDKENVALLGLWPGLGIDVTPHVGGALGNVMTYGAAGATVRFGENLENDLGGPQRIRPSLPGSAYFKAVDLLGWYLFAGAEGRAVARNIFLDGNTFEDSRSVDKEILVGDLQFGGAVIFPFARVAYTHIIRSKEYRSQDDIDQFGAISISFRF